MEAISLRDNLLAKDFIEGMRQCDIAVKYKISRTRVRQILNRKAIRTIIANVNKDKRGGVRDGSGAKPKYSEQTKTVAFRCPLSKVDELKNIVKSKLSEWSVK